MSSIQADAAEPERITPQDAWTKIDAGALLIDNRTPEEFSSGHIPGAINIPHNDIENHLNLLGENKEREIVLYCGSGKRSSAARAKLHELEFKKVYNAGGYKDLKRE